MIIWDVSDVRFKKYGKVVKGYDCSELIRNMEEISLTDGVIYIPSEPKLEALEIFNEIQNRQFGGLHIQIGYCSGSNVTLDALEYHRSSEVDIAATDLILLLGRQQDLDPEQYTYDASKVEAFYVPAGTMVELYATTLHYAPCNGKNGGFRCAIVLPYGTNMQLETKQHDLEDRLLFAKNKWLIAHPDTDLAQQGAYIGIMGKKLSVED